MYHFNKSLLICLVSAWLFAFSFLLQTQQILNLLDHSMNETKVMLYNDECSASWPIRPTSFTSLFGVNGLISSVLNLVTYLIIWQIF